MAILKKAPSAIEAYLNAASAGQDGVEALVGAGYSREDAELVAKVMRAQGHVSEDGALSESGRTLLNIYMGGE